MVGQFNESNGRNFFLRKLLQKKILQETNKRNSLDDKILCFLILEFGEPRDPEWFYNLISCNKLLKFWSFLENSNSILVIKMTEMVEYLKFPLETLNCPTFKLLIV